MVARLDAEGKVVREGAQVAIGGNERYVSFCRRHWEDRMNGIEDDETGLSPS
jgi:thymidine kinase